MKLKKFQLIGLEKIHHGLILAALLLMMSAGSDAAGFRWLTIRAGFENIGRPIGERTRCTGPGPTPRAWPNSERTEHLRLAEHPGADW